MEISNILLRSLLVIVSFSFIVNSTASLIKRKKSQSLVRLAFTYLIWGTIALLSIFPELAHTISETLGLGENLNTLIFIGFVIVFIVIFRLQRSIETLNSTITDLVQKDAVRNITTTTGETNPKDSNRHSDIQRKG